MYEKGLKELEMISQAVGTRTDYVQGGGGNTSAKLSGELMAVKASGYQLKQITQNEGFVVVNYKDIKQYYESVDPNSNTDYEKDSVDFVKKSIVKMEGLKELRPSVEAGFHSILKRFVIHTHSVYANILCCAQNGQELAEEIFPGNGFAFLWVPYINPGFSLTLKIKEGIEQCMKKYEKFPEVVFMANHGLIVNSDDCNGCVKLHDRVNDLIKEYLKIDDGYPEIKLQKVGENEYISKTQFVNDFIKNNRIDSGYFTRIALYPDQLVYLNGNISADGTDGKVTINQATGEAVYKAGLQEAMTIEETLLAYFYVINKIRECKLPLKTMTQKEIDFISNWESERYRKSLLNRK